VLQRTLAGSFDTTFHVSTSSSRFATFEAKTKRLPRNSLDLSHRDGGAGRFAEKIGTINPIMKSAAVESPRKPEPKTRFSAMDSTRPPALPFRPGSGLGVSEDQSAPAIAGSNPANTTPTQAMSRQHRHNQRRHDRADRQRHHPKNQVSQPVRPGIDRTSGSRVSRRPRLPPPPQTLHLRLHLAALCWRNSRSFDSARNTMASTRESMSNFSEGGAKRPRAARPSIARRKPPQGINVAR